MLIANNAQKTLQLFLAKAVCICVIASNT